MYWALAGDYFEWTLIAAASQYHLSKLWHYVACIHSPLMLPTPFCSYWMFIPWRVFCTATVSWFVLMFIAHSCCRHLFKLWHYIACIPFCVLLPDPFCSNWMLFHDLIFAATVLQHELLPPPAYEHNLVFGNKGMTVLDTIIQLKTKCNQR